MDDKLIEKRVAKYVQIRDLLREMKKDYEAKCAPLEEAKNLLAGWMMDFLEKSGSQSIKTSAGTCYASTKTTAALADPQAFMDFVVKNAAFELLDRRANATAVKAYVKENHALPPGCNLNTMRSVRVNRPGEKAEDE